MKNRFLIKSVVSVLVILSLMPISIFAQKPRRDENYPPPDFIQKFAIIHEVCVEKTGVAEEAIKEFSDGEIHDDPALKCYMNCVFQEANVVDDEGEVHYEKLVRVLPSNLMDYVKHIVDACALHKPTGETKCDRAWSLHVCFKQTDPEGRHKHGFKCN